MLNVKEFHVAAYCPPNPAEKGLPSQICAEQYEKMRDAGVDLVYGHNEAIGGACEKETFSALDLCREYGMKYLVKDNFYKRFTALRGGKPFRSLNAEERRALGKEYVRSLERYKGHAAFGGVEFIDEPGYEMFEGIRFAKDIFDRECSGKLFYVNMLPYWTLCAQLQYGMEYPFFEEKEPKLYAEPKQCRYAFYLRSFLEKVRPQVLSYDAYPVLTLGGEEKMIHVALFDHLRIAAELAGEQGIPFWNFIQAGGKWEGCTNIRVPNEAEIALQINAGLAYGASGIQIFPYAFPNDWSEDPVAEAGLIGRKGEETPLYSAFRRQIAKAKTYGNLLVGMRHRFVSASGEYCGGLSPYAERLRIPDSDCIFEGALPYRKIAGVDSIRSDSQVLTGVFDAGGRRALLLVNDSTIKRTDVCIFFERETRFRLHGEEGAWQTAESTGTFVLEPGEGMLAEFLR